MYFNLDQKLALVGAATPLRLLHRALSASLGRLHLALVLHRIRPPSPGDWLPGMAMSAEDLDAVVELLLEVRRPRSERWLSVTFDDGYEDAAAYVESRASRFPEVEFILFVCPEKAETQAGFRWDLAELSLREGMDRKRAAELLTAPCDIESENARQDLRRVAAHPDFRLAGVSRLRALATLPNVSLGNHSNCHFEMNKLDPAQAELELTRSLETFQRLFGEQRHFAFPFGHRYFDDHHVLRLRGQGDFVIWTTGHRPYRPEERASRELVPRMDLDGQLGVRGLAAAIAGRCALMPLLHRR